MLGPVITIHTFSPWSVGSYFPGATLASATWPSGSRAFYIPFRLPFPFVITQAFWENGAAVSGNVDIGIYDAAGTRLRSSGSIAQVNVSVIQSVDLTDLTIDGGVFYLALAVDNTTGTMLRSGAANMPATGMASQNAAFPLPATATFAAMANAYLPLCGVTGRAVI